MVALYAVGRVVGLRRMLQQASRPDMRHAHRLYLAERQHGKVVHAPTAVLLLAAVEHRVGHPVAKQSRQELVYYYLLCHGLLFVTYSLDGIHSGSLLGGEETKQDTYQCTNSKAEEYAPQGNADR